MQNAEKISITLPPDMLRLIGEAVEAGEYASTSEALRDAVRAWQRQRIEDAERLAALRARVTASLADPAPSLRSRRPKRMRGSPPSSTPAMPRPELRYRPAALADLMRQSRHRSAQSVLGYIEPADLWRNNVTEGVFRAKRPEREQAE
jgi:antitoxin ParD1/3/4